MIFFYYIHLAIQILSNNYPSTVINDSYIPLTDYLSLLKTNGTFVQLGIPENGNLTVIAKYFIFRRIKIAGFLISIWQA